MTFQQPVLHKNTILYNVNKDVMAISKDRSARLREVRTQRNLLVNFQYTAEED